MSTNGLRRPDYVPETYLSSQDLAAEQRYRQQRLNHHQRYLHEWGVMCGLHVVPADDPRRPWAVQVCPGYAIDCCSNEIVVAGPAVVDVRDYLWRTPQGEPVNRAYVGLRYAEAETRPVPTQPPGCGCEAPVYQPTRIRESFQVDILWTLPESGAPDAIDICQGQMIPCPACPDQVYVILASLSLPASDGDPITMAHIDTL